MTDESKYLCTNNSCLSGHPFAATLRPKARALASGTIMTFHIFAGPPFFATPLEHFSGEKAESSRRKAKKEPEKFLLLVRIMYTHSCIPECIFYFILRRVRMENIFLRSPRFLVVLLRRQFDAPTLRHVFPKSEHHEGYFPATMAY